MARRKKVERKAVRGPKTPYEVVRSAVEKQGVPYEIAAHNGMLAIRVQSAPNTEVRFVFRANGSLLNPADYPAWAIAQGAALDYSVFPSIEGVAAGMAAERRRGENVTPQMRESAVRALEADEGDAPDEEDDDIGECDPRDVTTGLECDWLEEGGDRVFEGLMEFADPDPCTRENYCRPLTDMIGNSCFVHGGFLSIREAESGLSLLVFQTGPDHPAPPVLLPHCPFCGADFRALRPGLQWHGGGEQ